MAALHLIKLCVGADSIKDLADWQKKRAAQRKSGETFHVTRQTPKRMEEILAGGSIYWVIKGQIAVRQRIVELRPVIKDGGPHCAIMLDPKLVPTVRLTHRPFQGWRYLKPENAPQDLKGRAKAALSETLHAELVQLGLI